MKKTYYHSDKYNLKTLKNSVENKMEFPKDYFCYKKGFVDYNKENVLKNF